MIFCLSVSVVAIICGLSSWAYAKEGETAWRTGKVYKNLVSAGAKYQLEALDRILQKTDEHNPAIRHMLFFMGLDHLVLSMYGPDRKHHLKKASAAFDKAGNPGIKANLTRQLQALVKEISQPGKQEIQSIQKQVLNILGQEKIPGNFLIRTYQDYKKTRQLPPLGTEHFATLIKEDYFPLKIQAWQNPLKLYNPLNLICLSQMWLEKARISLDSSKMNYRNLYYLLDSLVL